MPSQNIVHSNRLHGVRAQATLRLTMRSCLRPPSHHSALSQLCRSNKRRHSYSHGLRGSYEPLKGLKWT